MRVFSYLSILAAVLFLVFTFAHIADAALPLLLGVSVLLLGVGVVTNL